MVVLGSTAYEMGAVVGITIAVIVCGAIPLTCGAARGHPIVGIIGALCTVPAASFMGCLGGLPVAFFWTIIIKLLPKPNRPLLSQAEIEAEQRRMRGY
jgi:hypothetical protein